MFSYLNYRDLQQARETCRSFHYTVSIQPLMKAKTFFQSLANFNTHIEDDMEFIENTLGHTVITPSILTRQRDDGCLYYQLVIVEKNGFVGNN